MIEIVVVDDHDLVRSGIRHMLRDIADINVVGEANSGEAALQVVKDLSPNVVLMDIKMPGIGGLEATRRLLKVNQDIKVLIITAYEDDLFPSRLLQAGASGYLTKSVEMEEMVRAIRAVNSGQRYITPEIAQQLAFKHLSKSRISPFEALSERELQVTLMIIRGDKAKIIAKELGINSKTVNSYRYRIFEKLKIKNDVALTHLAIQYDILESS